MCAFREVGVDIIGSFHFPHSASILKGEKKPKTFCCCWKKRKRRPISVKDLTVDPLILSTSCKNRISSLEQRSLCRSPYLPSMPLMTLDWNASSEVLCSATRVNATSKCNLFPQSACFLSPGSCRLVASNSERVPLWRKLFFQEMRVEKLASEHYYV